MKKHRNHTLRFLSLLLALTFAITSFSPFSYALESSSENEESAPSESVIGPENFSKVYEYNPNQFIDVPSSEWYADSVRTVFEYGLMLGVSETKFNPMGHMSIAESLTIASRLHNIYYGKNYIFQDSAPWYQTYVNYAMEEKIITVPYSNYNIPISRSEFAVIIASAFPLSAINSIEDGAIPDVTRESSYYDDVYLLYRAGILSGVDSIGTYNPNSHISRAEVAVILSRIANEQSRIHFELKAPILPESISTSENFFIPIGDCGKLSATILPENVNRGAKIEWHSSDPAIASVDSNGVVTGNAVGTAEITATTENGKVAMCEVQVATQEAIDQAYTNVALMLLKKQLKFPDTLTIHGIWASSKYFEDKNETWIDIFIYYSASNSYGFPVRKEFLTIWNMNTASLLAQQAYDYVSEHPGYRTVNID